MFANRGASMAEAQLSGFARWFVGLVFTALGLSFLISTGTVLVEFPDPERTFILASNSNLFIFFPTLGLVALAAFYVPSVIFTDLYWSRLKYGRQRFLLGCIVVAAASVLLSEYMNSTDRRPIWEIAPTWLAQDHMRPDTCERRPGASCHPSLIGATRDLRKQAEQRVQLSPLVRDCKPDPLLERPSTYDTARHCFPAHAKLGSDACCKLQNDLLVQTLGTWSKPELKSSAAYFDRLLFLPLKTFFVLVLILIGLFLIRWKARLVEFYRPFLPAMERGLQIGALAMLPWLVMDYGNQQVSDLLYGPAGGFPIRLSLVLLPWAMLLAAYFADRIQVELVRLVQLASGVLSAVAILNYRDVFDWSAKALGVSAPKINFIVVIVVSVAALIYLSRWIPGAIRGEDKGDHEPPRSEGGSAERPYS